MSDLFEYTKIRDDIWHIEDEQGVYCTLIKGSDKAVLIDTGYGRKDLRAFVESNITTPYIVINSHGHPDHIGGNYRFDAVYALKKEWDVIKHFEESVPNAYELKEIHIGQKISLGNRNILVVSLAGHTKGSVGFIVQEEGILIAGDALNECLWLFNYGSLSMADLYDTIKATAGLDFSTYLCGHSTKEYPKENLTAHLRNIENLQTDEGTKQNTIGFETFCSKYENAKSKSEIVFARDKIKYAISVIVPARDEEKYVVRCIKSIKKSARILGKPVEIIVVCNRCKDRTAELAQKNGVKVVYNEDRCIAKVRNAGIYAAQGRIIVTIDCDNRMTKGTLTEIYDRMESGKYIGGGAPLRFERYSFPLFLNDIMCRIAFKLTGLYCGIFWAEKKTFDAIGGFVDKKAFEDADTAKVIRAFGRKQGKKYGCLKNNYLINSTRKYDELGDWLYFKLLITNIPAIWNSFLGDSSGYDKMIDELFYDYKH